MSGGLVEDISKECGRHDHKWCDGKVKVPPELIPEGQDGIRCQCLCHRGWPGRRRGRR